MKTVKQIRRQRQKLLQRQKRAWWRRQPGWKRQLRRLYDRCMREWFSSWAREKHRAAEGRADAARAEQEHAHMVLVIGDTFALLAWAPRVSFGAYSRDEVGVDRRGKLRRRAVEPLVRP